jgi:hypothetical protein
MTVKEPVPSRIVDCLTCEMVVSKHLLMNWNRRHVPVHYGQRVVAAVLMIGALFAGGLCLVHAGEAIIVPGEKSKAGPGPENRTAAPREVFRLRDTTPGGSPLDVFGIGATPDQQKRLDPKEERRRRLQALEKKNWMVVNPGELQAEEENKNFLNIRDYSLDGLEKEDQSGNLMFRPLKDDNRRVPGQFRSSESAGGSQARQPGQREKAPPVTAEDDNDGASPRKDPQLGAHISSELNFKSMFEARQSTDSLTPKFNKSELTLQTLLNSGAPSEGTREQQARREEFRNFLNTPKTLSPLVGASDPINSRSDLTRQPLNPTFPQSLGGESANRPSSTPFGTTPNAVRPSVIPGLAGFDSQRDSGFPAAQPWGVQDNSRPSWQKPTTFEAPKRKF